MARGVRGSPATILSLPKVSFQKVEDEESTQPSGVRDQQAKSYGYNDNVDFTRPASYIRHIEPLEIDLARQVEYDMDEQDKEWLDAVNAERRKEQLNQVSYEVFEIIMDRLEKEWFDLTKNIPKPDLALPSEDSTCAICDDSEGENSNAIVFCDGCNLAVHQDCYGVPYIPEGQWLCRKCTVSPENPVSCILCPNEGGAFKQTVHGEWIHLLCAIWVPETRVANDVFMEPITGVDKISKQRWKLKCSVCDIREGACIQCAKTSCFLAFHATCARKEKLLLPMKSTQGSEPVALTCYCDRHLPKEQQDARTAALATEEAHEGHSPSQNSKLSKSARAYAKTYQPGPPLVPALIVDRIGQYISKVSIRKKREFLTMMCRYWSLKREARRGAPLLKRLHLEPWTASAGGKIQTDEEKKMKLEQLQQLRDDLQRVKMLARLAYKREECKRRQASTIQDILLVCLFSHEAPMRMVFEHIMALDRKEYFKYPVSKNDVPDYFDIVKKPMCWNVIDAKLDRHEYWNIQAFKDDINLVVNNAILYNKPDTPFYTSAVKIRTAAHPILEGLNRLSHHSNNDKAEMDVDDIEKTPTIGDLEPPLELLELLVSTDAIQSDLNLVLNDSPLVSLFNYELGRMKPPPPTPPSAPPLILPKKRGRRAGYGKKGNVKGVPSAEAEKPQGIFDPPSNARAPRTRRAVATAAAFEAEAHGSSLEEEVPTELSNEVSPRGSVAKRGGRRKVSATVVDSVDNQGSFKMFDAGWILHPEQRRGGTAPVEKHAVLRAKKRPQTDNEMSRLSTFSTTASENQTLQSDLRQSVSPGDIVDSMEVDVLESEVALDASEGDVKPPSTELPPDAFAATQGNELIPPVNFIQTASGTIIIEELDTPAIRRQKSQRRKEAKRRLTINTSLPENPSPETAFPPSSPGAGPSRSPHKDDNFELDSELSSLSDFENETPGRSKAAPIQPPRVALPVVVDPLVEPGTITLVDGKQLEGGTLVWAKAATYPWWPAVIFEDDDPQVPLNIYKHCVEMRKKRDGVIHIVRFYDKNSTWQSLGLDKLRSFGEDESLDQEMIAPNSRKQKWKSAAVREACRQAYRSARAEMETGSEVAESEGEMEVVPDLKD